MSPAAAWRPGVTRAALLAMETLWIYAVCAFLIAIIAEGGKPSLIGAGVIVFASFGISRLLQISDFSVGLMRVWGLLLSFIVFYCVVRVDFFADWRFWDFSWVDALFNATEATGRERTDATFGVPVLWLFWLRGVQRGQQRTGFDDVVMSFAIGLVVIIGVELFASQPGDTPGAVSIVPVPFVALGLLAIALSHAARSEDEFSRSFAPTWIVAVGGAILSIGTIALILVLLDYAAVSRLVTDASEVLGWVVGTVFFYVSWPFFKVLELIFLGISDLLANFATGNQGQNDALLNPGEAPQPEEGDAEPLPAWAQDLRRILTAAGVVALLLITTALLFKRFRRREAPNEVRESLYQEGRLTSDLGNLIGSLLGRFRGGRAGGRDLDAVRRLYFDVLHAAHDRGLERRASETPLELAPRLTSLFAAETPRQITAAFDDARYGGLPPPASEVEQLRAEWEEIRKMQNSPQ